MKRLELSLKQMIEIDGCTRCGECMQSCPVYAVTKDQQVTPIQTLQTAKDWIKCNSWFKKFLPLPKPMNPKRLNAFSKEVYQCTLCGRCEVVCPVNIRSKEMRISLRKNIATGDLGLSLTEPILENLKKGRNVAYPTNDDRLLWLQNIPDISSDQYRKDKAEVVYFVGCVASFFPMTYSIPQNILSLLINARVNFSLLGANEWCCGWPLIGIGREDMAHELMSHNIETVNAMGAKTLLCGCPSCYYMWKYQYLNLSLKELPQFEVVHTTEYFLNLLKEERISLSPIETTVTYHDPCDLGRGLGIYDPPREIIQMISGVNFVELRNHRSHSTCCGGGGDLEMFFPNITREIAELKIKEIDETKAEVVLSACQQCKRTLALSAKKQKKKFKLLDLSELILLLSDPSKALAFKNLLHKTS